MSLKKLTNENIFCLLYFIWGLYSQIVLTVNIPLNLIHLTYGINIITILGLLFLFLKHLFDINWKLEVRQFFYLILFIFLNILVARHLYGIFFFTASLFVINSGYINFKSYLKTYLSFSIVTFIITIFLNKINVITSKYSYGDGRIRNSLGFSYFSFPNQIFFYCICAYIAIRNKKIRYIELAILEIINFYLYSITSTRDPFYLGTILIILIFIIKLFNYPETLKNNFIFNFFMRYSYFIVFFIYLWIIFYAPRTLFNQLDNLLSGRLHLSLEGLQNWGVSLFGQKISFITTDWTGSFVKNYNYVDSAYIQMLIAYGTLFTFLIFWLFTKTIKKMQYNNEVLVIILWIISFHGAIDPQLLLLWYSPFYLLLGSTFFEYKKDTLSSISQFNKVKTKV